MALSHHFPASTRLATVLTGRTVRRVCMVVILLLLVAATVSRVFSLVLTRRVQAVISGLSKLQIDETTEGELLRTVPHLIRGERDWDVRPNDELGNVEPGVQQSYYVTISSSERKWMSFLVFADRFSRVEYWKDGPPKSWILTTADLLGYRYLDFSANVVIFNGKVSSISYRLADYLAFPQSSADFIRVKSVHARWHIRQMPSYVQNADDENVQFNVRGDARHFAASFTPEASPALISHAFQLNLRCFWGLTGCQSASQIASSLWQDKDAIEAAMDARMIEESAGVLVGS